MGNSIPDIIDLYQVLKNLFLPCSEWAAGKYFQQGATGSRKLF